MSQSVRIAGQLPFDMNASLDLARLVKKSMTHEYSGSNPTNAVGGLFISNLALLSPQSESDRLRMNNPPTALVGFGTSRGTLVCVG
jgi:hypothetical protein